jgi:hypothetical protein
MRVVALPLACLSVLAASACTVVNPPPAAVTVAPPPTSPPAQQTAYCREFTATATVDGKPQETIGTACQQPDGRWRIVSNSPPGESAPQGQQAAPAVIYPAYAYPYYYYPYPYPAFYGPTVGIGVGFRFGGHHHHRFRH